MSGGEDRETWVLPGTTSVSICTSIRAISRSEDPAGQIFVHGPSPRSSDLQIFRSWDPHPSLRPSDLQIFRSTSVAPTFRSSDPQILGSTSVAPLHTRRARERVKQYTSAVLASLLRRRPLLVVRADRSDHPTAHSRISTAQMAAQSGFSDRPKSLMRLSARLMWPRKM